VTGLRAFEGQMPYQKAKVPSKAFWKVESPNAISGIHLGGMAKKIFFLVTKLFCFSR